MPEMRHVPSVMDRPAVVSALFEASPRLIDPIEMLALLRCSRSPEWPPVSPAEISQWLRTAQEWMNAPEPSDGWPTNWRWTMGGLQLLLQRARRARRTVSVLAVTGCIRLSLDGHDHHVLCLGHDPYEDERVGMLYLLARLAVETRPQPWERRILAVKRSERPVVPRHVRIRNQRQAKGLSQGALAARVGVARSTVIRWESGERRPGPRHREALALALGGRPSDYDG